MKKLPLIGLLLLCALPALADTRYVVDELSITVRSGPSTKNQVVKILRSGAKINVLTEIESNGRQYAQVEAGNTTGWVLTQYLSSEPIAKDRLQAAEKKLANALQQNANLKTQLATLKTDSESAIKQRDKLNSNAQSLDAELEKLKRISARPIQLEENNKKLRTDLASSNNQVKLLIQENDSLKNRTQRDWFVVGAVVVLISIIFGILLTRIRWGKRSSWGNSF